MSFQRQSFLILSLCFAATTTAFAADSTSRLITVPERLDSAGGCAVGSKGKVQFSSSAAKGETISCDYQKEGSNFAFKGCSDSKVKAGDTVIADSVTASLPTTTVSFPRIEILWVPYYEWVWSVRMLFGIRCGVWPIWTMLFRPIAIIVWETRTVGGCNDTAYVNATSKLFTAAKPACSGIASANTHLLGDLNCPSSTFAGIQFSAKEKVFDGRRHSVSAPNASLGMFAMGPNLTIRNLTVSGVVNGTGLQAYNTDKLTVEDNTFTGNTTGLNVYSDSFHLNGVSVERNNVSGNKSIGIKFNGDNGFRATLPKLRENNMNNSGYYAGWFDVNSLNYDGNQKNTAANSRNGIMFLSGDIIVTNLDMSKSNITGTQMFFNGNSAVYFQHVDLSYSAPATPTQERVAAHFYRVVNLYLDTFQVNSGDVGVKLATDSGVQTISVIKHSRLANEVVAGVMVQSYDGTLFGSMDIRGNDLSRNGGGRSVWFVPGTKVPLGALISGNTL